MINTISTKVAETPSATFHSSAGSTTGNKQRPGLPRIIRIVTDDTLVFKESIWKETEKERNNLTSELAKMSNLTIENLISRPDFKIYN
jgi:hypothetical protein